MISGNSLLADFKGATGSAPQFSPSVAIQAMRGADYSLFVLKLEDEHYFVGYSTKPAVRIKRHFAGKGAD
ncbi:hypothetical protein AO353_24170 [Pseudomonas fluorescens]|uniref:GIY-YIG domain-containing protein n=2 Tax=Pseudomonas TaxID=286 RepID=A0A0N9WMX2_PSEFL|nr:hypothetical protein AO353_24170 [Pseudomonas fluorescens]